MKSKQVTAIVILALAGWLLAGGWLGERGLGRIRQLIKQYYQLVTKTGSIQKKNLALQEEVRRLKDDKFWLEKQVREKLGWARPGDVIYKFKTMQSLSPTEETRAP